MTTRVIFCPGVFDLLHQGHLNILRASRELGDVLVVGVVSDRGAEAYKRRPVQDEQTRLEVIKALRIVDAAYLQPTTDPSGLLEVIRPRPSILTHGSDWSRLREGHATLARLGIKFVRLPYTEGISTGQLIERAFDRALAEVR